MAINQTISILLNDVREAYIINQKFKGMRSSGRSAESIRIESDSTSGTVYGSHYWYQQIHGRKPGKFPPISEILDWIRHKGIKATDIPERSLAFLIARKIAEKGTDIYQGRREGINVEDKIKELVAQFRERIAKDIKSQIVSALS